MAKLLYCMPERVTRIYYKFSYLTLDFEQRKGGCTERLELHVPISDTFRHLGELAVLISYFVQAFSSHPIPL